MKVCCINCFWIGSSIEFLFLPLRAILIGKMTKLRSRLYWKSQSSTSECHEVFLDYFPSSMSENMNTIKYTGNISAEPSDLGAIIFQWTNADLEKSDHCVHLQLAGLVGKAHAVQMLSNDLQNFPILENIVFHAPVNLLICKKEYNTN